MRSLNSLEVFVRMLGEFSLSAGDVTVRDRDSRSYKLWTILAYLIYNKGRIVSQEELIRLLGGEEKNSNPAGALKTALYRARKTLQPLDPTGENDFISSRPGGYGWNTEIPTIVDAEEFERLCRKAAETEDENARAVLLAEALSHYKGDFLGRLSSDPWAEQISAYYNNLYLDAVAEAAPILTRVGRAEEAETLLRSAMYASPYDELLCRLLMENLMEQEKYDEAADAYEGLRKLLFSELGVLPEEETQEVYREVMLHAGDHSLSPDMIRDRLRETDPVSGALVCDYATFRLFYQAEARSAARRGDAIHIGVLTVTGKNGAKPETKQLERAMDQLHGHIQSTLRMGDVAARCSSSQYIIMLLQANYENSEMVCRRVVRAFTTAHPRAHVTIDVEVLPLEPLYG